MTQEDINEVMANSLKRYQLEHLVFDGGNIESAKRLIRLLQAENTQLKAQLTWRPVSENPEEDGWYLAKHDTSDEPFVLSYKDGVWLFFDYDIGENVITNPPLYWLPIPPTQEVI